MLIPLENAWVFPTAASISGVRVRTQIRGSDEIAGTVAALLGLTHAVSHRDHAYYKHITGSTR